VAGVAETVDSLTNYHSSKKSLKPQSEKIAEQSDYLILKTRDPVGCMALANDTLQHFAAPYNIDKNGINTCNSLVYKENLYSSHFQV